MVTAKALKYHAGVLKEDILKEDPDKISEGLSNLQAHIDNLRLYHVPFVVCLNQYTTDSEKEISSLIGNSPAMQELHHIIEKVMNLSCCND